jgi:E3 ubiquitin-protein ligase synoviolin
MPEGALQSVASSLTSVLNSHKLLLYSVISTVTVLVAIINSLQSYNNFYSIVVYLSKSSRSVVILANFTALASFICGKIVQCIFFGPLRPAEVERLYDRLWFFVTESLLTFTIFRDEFDIPFGLMFGFLLFIKSFHWLASDRIEWMEQRPYPGPPFLFHVRMNALFFLLGFTDMIMFLIAIQSTLSRGVGGMVLFASEYAVLLASIGNTVAKYLLTAYELRRAGRRGGELAPPWEAKSMWIFYLELVTDFLKLSTYLLFFTVIVSYYGFPLSIIRDIYLTARSFVNRLRALHRYQNATRNMDEKYPSATEEDMLGDKTCIICREEMVLSPPEPHVQSQGPNITPKKLPCGHIFHFYCLRSWLERQQSCPTCRRNVLENTSSASRTVPRAPPGGQGLQNVAAGPEPMNGAPPVVNPGLLGRLLGPPAEPPMVHGQLPPNPDPLALPTAQQPHEVVIQYRIQYGNGARAPTHPLSHSPPTSTSGQDGSLPRSLRSPPRLAGYEDPAGTFIPWDLEERHVLRGAERPSPANPPHGSTKTDQGKLNCGDPTEGDLNILSSTEETPSAESDVTRDSFVRPREAARLAALRRHAAVSPTDASLGPINLSSNRAASIPTPVPEAPKGPQQASQLSPSAGGAPPSIPSLIPLYDLSELRASLHPFAAHHSSIAVPPSQSNSTRTLANNTLNNHASLPTPSLADRSSAITEAQLLTLDQLTREAIDERLRVLDGVSGTLTRCIEELTRFRSTLPQPILPQSQHNEICNAVGVGRDALSPDESNGATGFTSQPIHEEDSQVQGNIG